LGKKERKKRARDNYIGSRWKEKVSLGGNWWIEEAVPQSQKCTGGHLKEGLDRGKHSKNNWGWNPPNTLAEGGGNVK